MSWDPEQYERYEALRRRPAHDLVAALPDMVPARVVDLGCGTGRLARDLAARWPGAAVTGVDNAPAMLAKAAATPSSVAWEAGDLTRWRPSSPVDLLISNAALQWIGDHARLFPELAGHVAPGGVMAVQMPRNFAAPSHALLRQTAAEGPWAARLAGIIAEAPVHEPQAYFGWLRPLARRLDIWETEYLQELTGPSPVLEWVKGTALVPVLDALADDDERHAFLDTYRRRLDDAYPVREDGITLFPFRRLFIVAGL